MEEKEEETLNEKIIKKIKWIDFHLKQNVLFFNVVFSTVFSFFHLSKTVLNAVLKQFIVFVGLLLMNNFCSIFSTSVFGC